MTTPPGSRGGAPTTTPHTPRTLASASPTQASRSRGLLLSPVQGRRGSAWAPGGAASGTPRHAPRSGPSRNLSEREDVPRVAPRTSRAVLSALQAAEAVLRTGREPCGAPPACPPEGLAHPPPPHPTCLHPELRSRRPGEMSSRSSLLTCEHLAAGKLGRSLAAWWAPLPDSACGGFRDTPRSLFGLDTPCPAGSLRGSGPG